MWSADTVDLSRLRQVQAVSFDRDYRITRRGESFRVPGVTDIVGILDKPELHAWREQQGTQTANAVAKMAADRGTRVHAAALLLAQGQRILGGPADSAVDTCVVNIAAWLELHLGETLLCETPVYHRTYLYAGRPDLLCTIRGRQGVWLLDLKASKAAKPYFEWVLQVAGYAQCDEVRKLASHRQIHGAILQVNPEGDCTPRLHEIKELAKHEATFLHALAIYNRKKEWETA